MAIYPVADKANDAANESDDGDSDAENWDREIEEVDSTRLGNDDDSADQKTNSGDDRPNMKINDYLPAIETFSATAFYDSFFLKRLKKRDQNFPANYVSRLTGRGMVGLTVVDGQFEDAVE